MYKGRKETTHEGVGERKTYINIKKEIVQCMSINGHKTSCTRVMYLKRKKRKDTYYPHYIPQKVSTLPLTKWSYTNSPPKIDYSHTKTTPPFCHE